ncbi:glycosyltransferase family 39 protein [Brunnivagina elsteri]|uniref:Glycosyltransferase RgtA/B/C/D-like domain-containing protein n=1 Tax=Brunnivagina elsteri CCALA 953 TaxID=987040 RepID=A0A2A2TBA9_9CYAN|nr:hypothetical protein [Calothrix elsteri]PAX49806.1 hypothetical protein CK510_27680 [Calothrix elsteri CCALA 953]
MRHLRIAPNWLRYFIVVVLVLSVFFRFVNLDRKVFWHDETYTMLRLSGYTTNEVKSQVFNSRIISPESLFRYQNINSERDLSDTIRSLAMEDPQHPPLYYIIARVWVQVFGQTFANSVIAVRSLSAVISLLVIPAMYWLCWELFKVPLGICWIAIALVSSSPLQFAYAQEAREYILWAVSILVSSAALLRAIRLDSKREYIQSPVFNWGIYSLTLALSLYTFLLSGFVFIAHAVYVIITNKFRGNKTVKNFIVASLVSFLFFSPWLLILMGNFFQFEQTTAWTATQIPLISLIQSWFLQITRIFFDLNSNLDNIFGYFVAIFFLILVGYAIYFLCLTTNIKTWLFILSLICIPALPLILPDLLFGGMRSTSERYLIPSYLGIQIAIAYLFAYQINNGKFKRRQIWQVMAVLVISLGLISIVVSSKSETWWNKVVSDGNPQVARIINRSQNPLLISNDAGINYGNVFSLSYLLEPETRFVLVQESNSLSREVKLNQTIFILNPSNSFRREIEAKYGLRAYPVYVDRYYSLLELGK